MRTRVLAMAVVLAVFGGTGSGCDDANKEPDLGLPKTKSVFDLKQTRKAEMTKEELEDARRKAGFKPQEEVRAEALAAYEKMEKAFVKEKAKEFKAFVKAFRKKLAKIEKAAPKWAKAKDPDAAFAKFDEKYKAEVREFMSAYDEMTEKGTRGGDLIAKNIGPALEAFRNLNGDLGAKTSESEQFAATLKELRAQIDAIATQIDEIEKDEGAKPEGEAEAEATKAGDADAKEAKGAAKDAKKEPAKKEPAKKEPAKEAKKDAKGDSKGKKKG